jgi:hypothetical protein
LVLVGSSGVALIAAAKAASSAYWQPLMLELGAGISVFVALQLFASRALPRAGVASLFVLGVGLEVTGAFVAPGYWRALLITLGIGLLLFLALDLFMVRFLLVRLQRAQRALALLRPIDLSHIVDEQQRRDFEELLAEYEGHNPFNPFAGLGAPEDWERQWQWEVEQQQEREQRREDELKS